MKKLAYGIVLAMLLLWILPGQAFAAGMLVPGGQLVGLELQDGSVTVAGFDENCAEALEKAGLAVGDKILKADGKPVSDPEDIKSVLEPGKPLRLLVDRNGKQLSLELTPQGTDQGPRLGVYLRRGITGVGTVTWYDPDTGKFGTLGHGVNDCTGKLLALTKGSAYTARILTVKRGRSGEPGQLMGAIASREAVGTLWANTSQGVFGTAKQNFPGEALSIGVSDDVRTGPAVIRSTVDDKGVREYSVEILKIYPKSRENGRNLLLKVTDPELLKTTGGIVQGMGVSYNKDNQWNP